MNCDNCELRLRIESMERDLERNSHQHEEFYNRFGKIENFQARIDEKYSNIMKEIDKICKTLEELKSAPAKNWNAVVTAGISGVVGAVVGFMMHGGI